MMVNKTLRPQQVNANRIKAGLPPLNFKLFRAVIKKLETAPAAYDQENVVEPDNRAPCGTAACIGGWAYLLAGKRVTKRTDRSLVLNRAAIMLGLNEEGAEWEEGDAGRVFSGTPEDSWPEPFLSDWQQADGREEEAAVAVRYLKHILATGDVN